ncbi:MAG TPA: cell division protein FtsZ [Bryobacteraceae bacterium]|nr:cell division protein FtsZ [Bryobacteraceae bacterium]
MGLIDSDLNDLKYEMEEEARTGARFKVIGVGGGGCNAVARMVQEGVEGVEFYAMNTDLQALSACPVPNKLQLGTKVTNGLGAGSNPEVGRRAALENTDAIVEILQGADMVFVTAGLGGGTGTGAAPVIASLARELDALVVAVVTKPFAFEGTRRKKAAEAGITQLAATVDSVIAIPNDRLLSMVPRGTSICESFRVADDVLRQTVQGITDIIITPGLINRDFADIRATMVGMGYAMMGTAIGHGENAAADAARQAISCPLLEETSIAGARGVLINITASGHLGLHDVDAACAIIREATECEDVQLNFGVTVNEAMGDAVKITVIATGFRTDSLAAERWEAPEIRIQARPPEPVAVPPSPPPFVEPEPVMELPPPEAAPEPVLASEPEPVLDMDDLDTPAYLRQGRLLN